MYFTCYVCAKDFDSKQLPSTSVAGFEHMEAVQKGRKWTASTLYVEAEES